MTVSGDYVFVGLIILAGMVTLLVLKVNLLLFRLGSALSWLVLSILLLTNQLSLGISQPWTQVLGLLFLVMTISPLTLQMVTEIKTSKGGMSWSEWGRAPKKKKLSRGAEAHESYKSEIKTSWRR